MTSKKIVKWLKKRPLISVNALEKMHEIPQSTIGQALNGSRDIPDKFIQVISKELKKYGLK